MSTQYLHYDIDLLSLYPNARLVPGVQPLILWIAEKGDSLYAIVNQLAQLDESTTPISTISAEALSRAIIVMECQDEDERFRVISMFRGEGDPGPHGGTGTPAGRWPPSPRGSDSAARVLGEDYEARDWK